MSWADATMWLVYLTAPGQTLFVILYATGSPWFRSLIGRALLTKATALALLLDLTIVADVWRHELPEWIGFVVMGLIAAGAYMQLVAYVLDRVHVRRYGGPDRFAPKERRVAKP